MPSSKNYILPNPFEEHFCGTYLDVWTTLLFTLCHYTCEHLFYEWCRRRRLAVETERTQVMEEWKAKNRQVHEMISERLLPLLHDVADVRDELVSFLADPDDLILCDYYEYVGDGSEGRQRSERLKLQLNCSYYLEATVTSVIRNLLNILCLVAVMMRLGKYYRRRSGQNNAWRNYVAFVVALLYLPVFKIRASIALCLRQISRART